MKLLKQNLKQKRKTKKSIKELQVYHFWRPLFCWVKTFSFRVSLRYLSNPRQIRWLSTLNSGGMFIFSMIIDYHSSSFSGIFFFLPFHSLNDIVQPWIKTMNVSNDGLFCVCVLHIELIEFFGLISGSNWCGKSK